jgi:hypothetical protein
LKSAESKLPITPFLVQFNHVLYVLEMRIGRQLWLALIRYPTNQYGDRRDHGHINQLRPGLRLLAHTLRSTVDVSRKSYGYPTCLKANRLLL